MKLNLLVLVVCLMMLGCGSKKSTLTAATKVTDNSVATQANKESFTMESIHVGDTLQGSFPLPVLTEKPVLIAVESAGTTLDLQITKTGIVYKAIPKVTGTTTIHSVKESDSKAVADVVLEQKVVTLDERAPWRPPWWWYLVIVIVGVGVWYYVKYNLNPISSLIKFITK